MADSLNQTVMTAKQFEPHSEGQQKMLQEMSQLAEQQALAKQLSPEGVVAPGPDITTVTTPDQPALVATPGVVPPIAISPPVQPQIAPEEMQNLTTAWDTFQGRPSMVTLAQLEQQIGMPKKAA